MSKESKAYIGHIMVAITIITYGFNTNFMKILVNEWVPPYALVLLRCSISFLGFGLIWFFFSRKKGLIPTNKERLMMMLGGVLGMGGNLLFYISGIALTRPVDAFVIRTFQPIMVMLFALIFFHRRFNFYNYIGVLLGIAGTLFITLFSSKTGNNGSLLGDLFVLLASVCSVLYLILLKPYVRKYNGLTVAFWMSFAAFLVVLPFGIKDLIHAPILKTVPPLSITLELAFVLIIATLLSYYLSVKALTYISAFIESAYIYALPIIGTVIAIIMKTDTFSWHDPIAFGLVLLGFILVNVKNKGIPHSEISKNQ